MQREHQPITEIVNEIGRTFASNHPSRGGHHLMMWREEQRAIAELMTLKDQTVLNRRYVNSASFARQYAADFAPWFDSFIEQLTGPVTEKSPRLKRLELFTELVKQLEESLV